MKRRKTILRGTAALLAAGMLISALPSAALAAESKLAMGDLSGDGRVSLDDAQLALRGYTEVMGQLLNGTITPEQIIAGDLTETGRIDLRDVQFILKYYSMNELGQQSVTWDTLLRPVQDEKDARPVVEALMKAIVAKDVDQLLALTNLDEFYFAIKGEPISVEDVKAQLLSEDNQSTIKDYEIGAGASQTETMNLYNNEINSLHAEAKEKLEQMKADPEQTPEDIAKAEHMLEFLQPLDGLVEFKVTATVSEPEKEDESRDETFYVCRQNGEWIVDVSLISSLLNYVKTSKNSSSNTAAKSLHHAVVTAVTDLDEKGVDVQKYAGDYYFKGSDFKDLSSVSVDQNSDAETVKRAMMYEIYRYFDAVADLEELAFCVQSTGACSCAAVSRRDDQGKLWYGCYPGAPSAEINSQFGSIQEALAYVKKQYNN